MLYRNYRLNPSRFIFLLALSLSHQHATVLIERFMIKDEVATEKHKIDRFARVANETPRKLEDFIFDREGIRR